MTDRQAERCMNCGERGHRIDECPARQAVDTTADKERFDAVDLADEAMRDALGWSHRRIAENAVAAIAAAGWLPPAEVAAREAAAEQREEALTRLADRWDNHDEPKPGGYPEASAWADGVECGYGRAADEMREVLARGDAS